MNIITINGTPSNKIPANARPYIMNGALGQELAAEVIIADTMEKLGDASLVTEVVDLNSLPRRFA